MLAICKLSTIPLRADAKDSSEMVSQLLFGETFEVLDNKDNWLFIQQSYDGYQGWIDEKQCLTITELPDTKQAHCNTSLGQASPIPSSSITPHTPYPLLLSPGSTLPYYNKKDRTFKLGEQTWQYTPNHSITQSPNHPINQSYIYLNTPYLWGGRSIFGIDCSGLTQVVFKMMGIPILRDASQQAIQGTTIRWGAIQEGDLAFFSTKSERITHVGIILENNQIIHAHGQVRIDRLDETGIYNEDQAKYTHRLRWVKRMRGMRD